MPAGSSLVWDNINYDLTLTLAPNFWTGGAGGLWSMSSSWSGQPPLNAVGATALFNGSGSSPVSVDVAITLGKLQYSSSASYDIQGPASPDASE